MAAWSLLLWVLVLCLPGVALLRLLGDRGSWLETIGVAAPVSFGLAYVTALAGDRLGVPVLRATVGLSVVLVVAWLVVEGIRLRRGRSSRVADPDRNPQVTVAWFLLGTSMVVGVALWQVLHARLGTPPGWDAMHHGYFTRQIVDHQTLSSSVVLSTEADRSDSTTGFYPLAMNLVAAAIHDLSGLKISTVLLTCSPALCGVLMPVSTFALCRRLVPGLPLVAGFSALATVLPTNIYLIEFSGRLTAVHGLALVPPVVLLLVCGWDRARRSFPVAGALAVLGITGVHTSETVLALFVASLVVLTLTVQQRRWRDLVYWIGAMALLGALSAVVLLALEPGIRGLVGERSGSFGQLTGGGVTAGDALGRTLVQAPTFISVNAVPMGVWSVLAWVGCLTILRRAARPLVGLAASNVLFAAFYVAWLTGHPGPFARLGTIWYADPVRMEWVFLALGAIPIGCLLGSLAEALAAVPRWWSARRAAPAPAVRRLLVTTALASAAVVVVTLVASTPPVHAAGSVFSTTAAPVGPDYGPAFAYLERHVRPGDRVLDDLRNRGEMWVFVDDDVPTLFGNAPLIGDAPASWKERLYLRARLAEVKTNGCVGRLMRKYRTTYLLLSDDLMAGGTPELNSSVVAVDPEVFRPVFRNGDVRVYQIVPPKRTPCRAGDLITSYPWDSLLNAH